LEENREFEFGFCDGKFVNVLARNSSTMAIMKPTQTRTLLTLCVFALLVGVTHSASGQSKAAQHFTQKKKSEL